MIRVLAWCLLLFGLASPIAGCKESTDSTGDGGEGASGGGGASGSGGSQASSGTGGEPSTDCTPVGVSTDLAEGDVNAAQIAVTQDAVFWGSYEKLQQTPRNGGETTTAYAMEFEEVGALASSGDTIFFSQSHSTGYKALFALNAGGSPALFGEKSGIDLVQAYPHENEIYIAFESVDGNGIARMPLSGGAPVEIVTGLNDYVADLAVADGWVYWVTLANGLYRAPVDGGQQEVLFEDKNTPTLGALVMADATHVYFTHSCGFGDGGLYRLPIAGGDIEMMTIASTCESLEDGGSEVYLGLRPTVGPEGSKDRIVAIAKNDKSTRDLWCGEQLSRGLRVASGELYHSTFTIRGAPGRIVHTKP